MKPDPRVRRDGTCYVCKDERPEAAVEAGDPFCTSDCAREFHGAARKTTSRDGRRMPTKAETKKRTEARKKKNPGANFEIRGRKRSAKVKP